MRILVYPHDLNMGGSQMNAIELAAAVRDLGHECVIYGRPGVLVDRVAELGLEFIPSPRPSHRPTPWIVTDLRKVARRRGIDVLHGYEWPPSLEAYLAASRLPGVGCLSTVMSMAVAPFLPRTMPLLVGTRQIAAHEKERGRLDVDVLEPPVDLAHNQTPSTTELGAFRKRWGLLDDRPIVVCVGRLAAELKAEGLLTAIEVARQLHGSSPFQLVLIGDGPARAQIQAAASAVNAFTGESTVVLTGEVADPRAAYAVADVALGMGGSALRSMAFGRPLIVQGEGGFFQTLEPSSLEAFRWQGWYGAGEAPERGVPNLIAQLLPLITSRELRERLGRYSLQTVQEYSLQRAAGRMVEWYEKAARDDTGRPRAARWREGSRVAGRLLHFHAGQQVARITHRERLDDFNAKPVAATATQSQDGFVGGAGDGPVVYLAGAAWDAVAGTDRQLATALAEHVPVIWVDPGRSLMQRLRTRVAVPAVSSPAPNLTRLSVEVPPGNTRFGVRNVANKMVASNVKRHLKATRADPRAIIASTTEPMLDSLDNGIPGRRVYFATDDFVAAAGLWGRSPDRLHRARERNLAAADLVLAVTPALASSLKRGDGEPVWFPNGADLDRYSEMEVQKPSPEIDLKGPIAGLVGQVNDRLDLSLLEALVAADIELLIVGPATFRDQGLDERFRRLVAQAKVQWVGLVPPEDLPGLLRGVDVGLTPYADTEFNRHSYPLKTVEYLAAGVPVVSTAMLPMDGLDRRYVTTAETPESFVAAVRERFQVPVDPAEVRASVQSFDWGCRAEHLLDLVHGTIRHESQRIDPV